MRKKKLKDREWPLAAIAQQQRHLRASYVSAFASHLSLFYNFFWVTVVDPTLIAQRVHCTLHLYHLVALGKTSCRVDAQWVPVSPKRNYMKKKN